MGLNPGAERPIQAGAGQARGGPGVGRIPTRTGMLTWFEQLVQRTSPVVLALCLLLFLVVGVVAGLFVARLAVRRRVATSRTLGRRGVDRALALLDRHGFEILEREVAATGLVQVDSRLEEYAVRADALVRRKGRVYVAEFKGGPSAASIRNRATRRQLLEYACVFGTDGILLVDANAGRVQYVRFVSAAQGAARPRGSVLAR